jgi:hypothetical protein
MIKKSPIKVDSTDYKTFLRDLNLFNICVVRSSSEIHQRRYFGLLSRKRDALKTLQLTCELSDVGDGFFDTTSTFHLAVGGSNVGKSALTIECVFLGHFHVRGQIRRELAQRFTDSELELIVMPYFRQFVFDTTARMSIPPITVPLYTGA